MKNDKLVPYRKITSIRKLKKDMGWVGHSRREFAYCEFTHKRGIIGGGVTVKDIVWDEIYARRSYNDDVNRARYSYKEYMLDQYYQTV